MRLLTNRLSDQLLRRLLANLTRWRDESRYCNQLCWSLLQWRVVHRRQTPCKRLHRLTCTISWTNQSDESKNWPKLTNTTFASFLASLPDLVTWRRGWWWSSLWCLIHRCNCAHHKTMELYLATSVEKTFLWETIPLQFQRCTRVDSALSCQLRASLAQDESENV